MFIFSKCSAQVRETSGSAGKSLLQSGSLTVSSSAEGAGSSASASGNLVASGPGVVSLQAEAVAQEFSVAEARNVFVTAVESAVAEVESGGDPISLADSVALAFAEAIAEAFIRATSVQLTSTGEGAIACGQATIPPDEAAVAAATVLVEVRLPLKSYAIDPFDHRLAD